MVVAGDAWSNASLEGIVKLKPRTCVLLRGVVGLSRSVSSFDILRGSLNAGEGISEGASDNERGFLRVGVLSPAF